MKQSPNDFKNPEKVREWYLGIHVVFKHIQQKNKWSKQKAWDKLKIELINAVGPKTFIPDDLDWVEGILIEDIYPTTDECLRVAQRYPLKTPLLDSLKKFI